MIPGVTWCGAGATRSRTGISPRARRAGDVALLRGVDRAHEPREVVLDAGCGAGVPVMRELAGAGMAVVGIDLSGRQLEPARSRVPGARLVHADLVALPFEDRSFDGLVSF